MPGTLCDGVSRSNSVCSGCNKHAKAYDLFDYCAECSKNLCSDCMKKGCCENVPAKSGMNDDASETDDEDFDKHEEE